MNRTASRAVILAVVLGGVAIGGLFPLALDNTVRERDAEKAEIAARQATAPGGLFDLVDAHGRELAPEEIRGRVLLVVFTSSDGWRAEDSARRSLVGVLAQLPPSAAAIVRPVLIDLKGDQADMALMAADAAELGGDALALTGSRAVLAGAARAYGLSLDALEQGGTGTNPAARVYLMDGQGRFRGVLEPGQDAAFWLGRLRSLTAAG